MPDPGQVNENAQRVAAWLQEQCNKLDGQIRMQMDRLESSEDEAKKARQQIADMKVLYNFLLGNIKTEQPEPKPNLAPTPKGK